MPETVEPPIKAKIKISLVAAQAAVGVPEEISLVLERQITTLTSKTLSAADLQKVAVELIQISNKKDDISSK